MLLEKGLLKWNELGLPMHGSLRRDNFWYRLGFQEFPQ